MSGLNNSERQLLQQLVTRLNLIEQNAKKIDELPLKSTLNGNDLLHISENGTSKKITMSNLLDIVQNRSFDHLVSVTNMQLIGNQFSVESATWEISSILNFLSQQFQQVIPYSASGLIRKDIVVGNSSNELVYIQGEENEGVSFAPPIPPSTVLITEFDVTDNSVNNSQPIIGDDFKLKIESSFNELYNAGSLPSLVVNDKRRNFILHNASNLHSLTFGVNAEAYPGQIVSFTNKKNIPIPFFHLSSNTNAGTVKFEFPESINYNLMPNETIKFHLNGTVDRLMFLSSNMTKTKSNNIILSDLNIDGSVFTQGVTGNVVLKSYLIPINKINKNGIFKINLRMSKPEGVEATFNSSVNFDTSINQFPFNSMNSGAVNNKLESGIRTFKSIYNQVANTCLMTSFTASGGYYTDYISHANVPVSKVVNLTPEGLRVFLIVNTTSLTDKIALDYLIIEFLEV